MVYRTTLVLLLFLSVGCGSTSAWRNPFAGLFDTDKRIDPTAPPRKTYVDASDIEGKPDEDKPGRVRVAEDRPATLPKSDIELTDFVPGAQSVQYTGATVVARVNGKPIFAEDVLQPAAGEFAKAAKQLSPEELNQLRGTFIRNNLTPHIEQAVLVTGLKNDVPRDQWDDLNLKVKELFDEHEIERLKASYKVTTRLELEQELAKQGTTLDKLKGMFSDQQLAIYYIKDSNKTKQVQYSRKDLLEWYEKNIEQFKFNSKVRWREVRINYKAGSPTSEDKAQTRMREVIALFKNRVPFEEIAKKHSDGPKAANGGVWDWTDKGTLAEDAIDRALFQLAPGSPSEVLDTGNAYVIVEVIERRDAGYESFDDVQDTISKKLQQSSRSTDTSKFIDELVKSATIWTAFDDLNAPTPARR